MEKIEFAVVLCTAPMVESEKIARSLVDEKLAACVNVFEVKSFFRWEGKLWDEKEDLLIVKTKKDKLDELIGRIKDLHSYEVPEIIALPIIEGSENYLSWIADSLK